MKISHEVPICLLEQSKQFNDYDYILPHLLDKFPAYESYMRQAKAEGRYLICDNSLHELGVPYSEDRLLYWINELTPNEFIVPDLWEDTKGTWDLATYWYNKISELCETNSNFENIDLVAVIQSKSYEDTKWLYKALKGWGYEKIAFSYGAEYYSEVFPHPNKLMSRALGRLQVISQLIKDGIIGKNDRLHLLGCNLPQEFSWYKGINIESIDTSNPIMAGIESISYRSYGLREKPKTKIDDVIDKNFNNITRDIISENIFKFKQINGF